MMQKLFDAVQKLRADNPLGLPIAKHVSQAVPVRGMNIRSGVFYVITEDETLRFARNLANHPRLSFLEKVRYNVLETYFRDNWRAEPGTVPRPDRAVLVIYDYTNNIGYQLETDFPHAKRVDLKPLKQQPEIFSEVEYQEAVQILASDPKFGEPLRRGIAFCSPGMPPVITESAPTTIWERFDPMPIGKPAPHHRTVSVLMHFRPGSGREGETGIFAIDMVDQRVAMLGTGESDFFPAACNGPASGGSCSSSGGNTWQALAWPASNPIWQMSVRRPSAGPSPGLGVEVRDVYYNGRLVLRRGGIPVLNVFYDGNACGPYRDWLNSETCFKCNGTDLGNGLRMANPGQKAITICDDANDTGNFRGVGVYEENGELVLISECSAGWYRYITGWRFHPDGIIRPRFLYGYTDSSCVCYGRLHNAYWRLHFDLDGLGGLVAEETTSPPNDPRARWTPFRIEARRYRHQNPRYRRWRVRKLTTGFTATFVPSPKDGYFELPTTGEADFWVMVYHAAGADDGEIFGSSGAFANISQYVNGERTYDADLVIWYGVHLRKRGADTFECPPLGPDIVLSG